MIYLGNYTFLFIFILESIDFIVLSIDWFYIYLRNAEKKRFSLKIQT